MGHRAFVFNRWIFTICGEKIILMQHLKWAKMTLMWLPTRLP